MKSAFLSVWDHHGKDASLARRIRTYYTGFTPCLLRAFPTNALALLAFEATMKLMGAEKVSAVAAQCLTRAPADACRWQTTTQ